MSDCTKFSLRSILWEIRVIILFYVIGDWLSTAYALPKGQEGNILLSPLISISGIYGLLLLKLLFVALLVFNLYILNNCKHEIAPYLKEGLKSSVAILGIVLTMNNILVGLYNWSFLGYMVAALNV
ncbi:hypothetical protein [uncultured Methanomethylovorans sp.]|uniref:hypothetical protein n=1 Tax=uncultured Methanomethylovorans sp. TaxID=183759 RepID=UPI002AA7BE90|nr:hypothetical protein [uncultured Methanomethylovorans sp.]